MRIAQIKMVLPIEKTWLIEIYMNPYDWRIEYRELRISINFDRLLPDEGWAQVLVL